jgi:hypothetical protein
MPLPNVDVQKEIEAGLADSAAGRAVSIDEVRRRFGLPERADDECSATEEAAPADVPNVQPANAATPDQGQVRVEEGG